MVKFSNLKIEHQEMRTDRSDRFGHSAGDPNAIGCASFARGPSRNMSRTYGHTSSDRNLSPINEHRIEGNSLGKNVLFSTVFIYYTLKTTLPMYLLMVNRIVSHMAMISICNGLILPITIPNVISTVIAAKSPMTKLEIEPFYLLKKD